MLILIPGATGNLGLRLVRSALRRGHQVRALGRSPSKIPADLSAQIESFIEIADVSDTTRYDSACAGVESIIVAWNEDPRLVLEAQLALLRAAERAGIKRFHAVSWNADWEGMPLGTIESYDPYISFARQAELTSTISPLYVFCGGLAMTLFGVPGAGSLEGDNALWKRKDGGEREINVVGSGRTKTPYSAEDDVADFSVALVTSDEAERGGYHRFCSDEFTMEELKAVYEKVRGAKCSLNSVMEVDACKEMIMQARESARREGNLHRRYRDIIGLVYAVFLEEGTYNIKPVDVSKFPEVPRTTLENYIRANDWV